MTEKIEQQLRLHIAQAECLVKLNQTNLIEGKDSSTKFNQLFIAIN